ncbi:FAD-binding and (Fe-S)-binding domain-containing protein [Falsiroseomonas sp.]|uniref:FAD-binding and (Fe-S)-binding domain-containing protein n=1 Tax=Falsiroseomonas sp. TaxID=2870721 RepID=UPI003565EB4B
MSATEAALRRHQQRNPDGRVRVVRTETPALAGRRLAQELARGIEGEVRFDDGSRALYATDASNYRQVPIGVVVPRSLADVERTIAICRRHGAPLVARGGGTSLAGQTTNTAVVLDFSKYLNRIIGIDPAQRRARVQPGCILDHLRHAAGEHGLTFGPDPATHNHNTLGGMIGNNSCGPHSIMAGRTADNVEAMEILTYRGDRFTVGRTSEEELRAILAAGGARAEIYRGLDALRTRYGDLIRQRFPRIPRRVSGYADLDKLLPENGFDVAKALVGTEGTCVTVLEATLRLVPDPPERALVVLGFDSIFAAADAVPRVLEFGPIACEGIDQFLVDAMHRKHLNEERMKVLPGTHDWLVVEFGGDTAEEAAEKGARLCAAFAGTPQVQPKLVRDPSEQAQVWQVREAGLPGSAYIPGLPETWEGWEDTAVPRERLGDYLRDFRALCEGYGYDTPMYGHFGDGLVHCRITFDLKHEEGVRIWRRFLDEAADLVVRYGGSISGEHGDGQSKAALIGKMYGPELIEAFREFKAIWDPDGRMNPGKVVDPYPITSNLRLGPSYQPPELRTHFSFAEEGGFADAAERCVGVGKCRRTDPEGGVMCPSFLATREEKHSTRGRARMLFEMVHGGPVDDGWRSEAVHDSLSLCLACKGCKSDCPVQVDMATYKAEFHSHYYAGRLRPRAAYSMGLIQDWARLASLAPSAVNALMRAPGIAPAAKWAGGIAAARQLPRFAEEPFTRWFARRDSPRGSGRRVILWPDTFNNFFRPETAKAAVRLLEAGGYEVHIPRRTLCCGRPLYDWGMLDRAKRLWRRTLDTLRADIEAGMPVVGLEPACVSAFMDELPNLFPKDNLARRLSANTHHIADFVMREPDRFPLRRAEGERAKVQMHCHHHAVIRPGGEQRLLAHLGVEAEIMRHGCCGMAGSFGFEQEKYGISQQIAERGLFPELRAAPRETWVIADGFSCREQIEQGTGRGTVHVAQIAAACLGRSAP